MDHNHLLDNLPDIMTVSQVQDTLKIGRTMVYRLLTRGEIKSVRIGRSYRIPKQYLMDYVSVIHNFLRFRFFLFHAN